MQGTRKTIDTFYRRWLAFLEANHPQDLAIAPRDRITPPRVREYVEYLYRDLKPVSAAMYLKGLHYVARFADSSCDWQWLVAIAARLLARSRPESRFHRLVPGWLTLDYGIQLMEQALHLPGCTRLQRELEFRDGLLLAFLSCWPLRRRSLAALTVSSHVEIEGDRFNILLHAEDTKPGRAESCPVDARLAPFLRHYLHTVRPRLLAQQYHDGLWVSRSGGVLTAGRLYHIARRHTARKFNKPMGLHDFRRSAATFLATEAPEMVGLIPGILHQAGPEVGERHYNLARCAAASRRVAQALADRRNELRRDPDL